MMYLGDFAAGATLYVPFHTFNSAGASVTIAGLAVGDIKIYKAGSTTQRSSTVGFTLLDTDGIDFDSITGIHGFSIDTSDNTDAGFYATAKDYWIVVDAVTVNTQTVSFVAACFSIENRSALRPTTAGRTLDVSAGGEAGIDWANVGSPTTTVGLSGTTVKTATDVETDTQDIQARLPAALGANGNIKSDVRDFNGTAGTFASGIPETKVASIAANALTATAINADAFTAAKFHSDVTTELQSGLATASALSTAASNITDIKTNTDKMVFTVANQLDTNVKSNAGTAITAAAGIQEVKVASVAANALNASALASDAVTEIQSGLATASALSTLQTSVDDIPTNAELATALAAADDAVLSAVAALSIPTANQNADAMLDRANAVETGMTPRQSLRLLSAALGGKLSGGATTTNTIKNAVADSKSRIIATVDADGNRTAITYDLT